jgi:hypothetical protein
MNNNNLKFEVTVQASLNFNTANVRVSELTTEQYTSLIESISQGASGLDLINQAVAVAVATSDAIDASGKKEVKVAYNNKSYNKPQGGAVKLSDKQIQYIKKYQHIQNFSEIAKAHEFTSTADRNLFTDFCFNKLPQNDSSFQPDASSSQPPQSNDVPPRQGDGLPF